MLRDKPGKPALSLACTHKSGRNITAVAVTFGMDLPVFLPENRHRHARTLQFARRADQSGSARRRWPCAIPVRPEEPSSRASSVTSSASGQASPAAAARFRLSWMVAARHAKTPPDLARAHPIVVKPQ